VKLLAPSHVAVTFQPYPSRRQLDGYVSIRQHLFLTDTAVRLYTAHSRALTTLHADLESYALGHREVFVGTAGSVVERANATGFRFYSHQSYDGDGKKRERYVAGPIGAPEADAAAEALRARIAELKALVPSFRMLAREGFAIVDPMAYATLAGLHNNGLFVAGAMLIGSHAHGVLLNRLGVRAAAYATEDIDIARGESLALAEPRNKAFVDMLRDSGLPFVEVPALDRKQPATSYKSPGRSLFHVDLLVPSRDESFPIVRVPELDAYATGLPYLSYLLAESQLAMVMGREGCCAVRVPVPERYAIHKLIISRLRTGRDAKSGKDVHQACVLAAALAEHHAGALEAAVAKVPKRARKHLARALEVALPLLRDHPRAIEELERKV
jgi:hypothetical protein